MMILQVQFVGTQLAKTLVEACQINSITNQILHKIKKKRKEEICVINSKARKKICLTRPVKEGKVKDFAILFLVL